MAKEKRLAQFSEERRMATLIKFQIIQPYLEKELTLDEIKETNQLSIRTLRLWIRKFRLEGIVGLVIKERNDKGKINVDNDVQKIIKKFHFENKNVSIATIHRKKISWCIDNQF